MEKCEHCPIAYEKLILVRNAPVTCILSRVCRTFTDSLQGLFFSINRLQIHFPILPPLLYLLRTRPDDVSPVFYLLLVSRSFHRSRKLEPLNFDFSQ
jgi:hypothetical protein